MWPVLLLNLDNPNYAYDFPFNMPALPADMVDTHVPAQGWSFRVPSPPRIVVPPPALNTYGVPDLHVVQDASYDFDLSGFTNADFLQTVTYGNFMTTNSEWILTACVPRP